MAPSKMYSNSWKHLSLNTTKAVSKNLRKTSTLKQRTMSPPKLNYPNKLLDLLTHKWMTSAGPVSGMTAACNNIPQHKYAFSSSSGSQNNNNTEMKPPKPILGSAIATNVDHANLSQQQTAVALWLKKLTRQMTDVTYTAISNWKVINASKSNTTSIESSVVLPDPAASTLVVPAEEKTIEVEPSSITPPVTATNVCRAALESRAHYLVNSMAVEQSSNMSRHIQIQELCKFVKQFPQIQGYLTKVGAQRQLLYLKKFTRDPVVLEDIEEGLALLGHCRPPAGWGIRILSIDGGGLRGMVALEVLRELEELTGKQIYQLFDYICGVSTGSVLAILLGSLKCSVSKCEQMYKQIGTEIFQQNAIWGTGKLVLSHAFYDTDHWTKMLREHLGESQLIETARDPACPKIAAVSTVVSTSRLEPFLFRNYDYPPRVMSRYRGNHQAQLWEAARASAAAPGYFEEFKFGNDIHQDGGILVNNPTALAIHECKQLWPYESLQSVISLGNGRYEPEHVKTTAPNYTGLKNKLMKIIDSATDTEAVHTVLHDLLQPSVYFRFNPYLSENISLDETRPEKMLQLQKDARMYMRRNENKLKDAASILIQSRSKMQHVKDFVHVKKETYLN